MTKKELLQALEKVQPGDSVIINGQTHRVDEALLYQLGDFEWLNLVSRVDDSEIVLEIAEGRARIWREVVVPGVDAKTEAIEYGGERYEQDEMGIAIVYALGTIRRVRYSVLEAGSGKKLSVEEWPKKTSVYISEGPIKLSDIRL